jgi:hypothetical protein
MNINPEFQDDRVRWENCDVYCDGKLLGKADIEFVLEFNVSVIKTFLENLSNE